MPNWVSNVVYMSDTDDNKVTDKDKREVVVAVYGEEECKDINGDKFTIHNVFNFDKIVPMPDEISNSAHVPGEKLSVAQKKMIAVHGAPDWYNWSCIHWGTKWNSADASVNEHYEFTFDTAWSTPYPVIEQLSKKFPNIKFTVYYADEDIGSNYGEYQFINGEEIAHHHYDVEHMTQPEAKAILKICKPYVDEIYDFDKGDWRDHE